ncbi:MAG: hypothetical protein WEF53_02910 [Bacteroidota bacterium]
MVFIPPLFFLLSCREKEAEVISKRSNPGRTHDSLSRPLPQTGSGSSVSAQPLVTKFSDWFEPLNLGPLVNSTDPDINPTLSPDNLSLYFTSNRPAGIGRYDIWVSRRACVNCPWEAAINLGPVINSTLNDNTGDLSADGLLMFFASQRAGGYGNNDIYVSRRSDLNDDFGWQTPVNLGPDINTSHDDAGPDIVNVDGNNAILYFSRGRNAGPGVTGNTDIYFVAITREGEPLGPPELVAEFSMAETYNLAPSVRADGKEIYFSSNRPGTLGDNDLWVSTRASFRDPWSAPVNLGPPLNLVGPDQAPDLSHDGQTLLFHSVRPGNQGTAINYDIWMSTRTVTYIPGNNNFNNAKKLD